MSFGSRDPDHDDVISEINMTPLVDVMLVLLIVFMITVPVLTHSVNIQLPRASNDPNVVRPETVTISIERDTSIHWNDSVVDMTELGRRLKEAAARQPQTEIHIRGDRAVGYEHVMRAMAVVQRAGIAKLSFISESEKGSERGNSD